MMHKKSSGHAWIELLELLFFHSSHFSCCDNVQERIVLLASMAGREAASH
jgi:hypothetical protein